MSAQHTDTSERDARSARRARLYNTHGVVLRRRDVGEADRIVTLYTNEFGKRSFSARGSRKTTSKIAGQIEPFSLVKLFVAQTRGLDIISQAQALELYPRLRSSEAAIATAGLFAELVDSLTVEEQPNPNVSELLTASLTLLDDGRDVMLVTVAFEMGLLRHLGYRPELYTCGVCGRELEPGEHGFSLESGVVCFECRSNAPSVLAISVDALKLLRAIDRGQLARLLNMKINPAVTSEADAVLAAYIQRIVGKESRARQVLRELRLQ